MAVKVLTADLARCPESRCNVGVELDVEVVVARQPLVPGVDLLLDPVGEGSAHHRVHDIHHPLPRQLGYVFLVGEVRPHLLVEARLLVDALEREALVLRAEQVGDAVALDELLLAGGQLFQEIYCTVELVIGEHLLVTVS